MAENSKIEWTDHTFNPWRGCTKVSPGCAHCYAETLSKRNPAVLGEWGEGKPRVLASEAMWRQPLKWDERADEVMLEWEANHTWQLAHGSVPSDPRPRRPRVFCASLGDWLDDEVPIEWLARLLALIYETPNLDWLLLTKRPQNFREQLRSTLGPAGIGDVGMTENWLLGEPPANVWIGTSVEDQERADERIPALLGIPARVRFLSCEPLLGPVDLSYVGGDQVATPTRLRGNFWEVSCLNQCTFVGLEEDLIADPEQAEADKDGTRWVCPECHSDSALIYRNPNDPEIHWIIGGGESGPNARPMHPDWARSLRDQCQSAGVPFLFKQWGEWGLKDDWPDNPSTRQFDDPAHAGQLVRWTCQSSSDRSRVDVVTWNAHDAQGRVTRLEKLGKKKAGRLLDGREWNEFPVVEAEAPRSATSATEGGRES